MGQTEARHRPSYFLGATAIVPLASPRGTGRPRGVNGGAGTIVALTGIRTRRSRHNVWRPMRRCLAACGLDVPGAPLRELSGHDGTTAIARRGDRQQLE